MRREGAARRGIPMGISPRHRTQQAGSRLPSWIPIATHLSYRTRHWRLILILPHSLPHRGMERREIDAIPEARAGPTESLQKLPSVPIMF